MKAVETSSLVYEHPALAVCACGQKPHLFKPEAGEMRWYVACWCGNQGERKRLEHEAIAWWNALMTPHADVEMRDFMRDIGNPFLLGKRIDSAISSALLDGMNAAGVAKEIRAWLDKVEACGPPKPTLDFAGFKVVLDERIPDGTVELRLNHKLVGLLVGLSKEASDLANPVSL